METPSLVAGIGIGIAIGIMLGFVISPGSSVTVTEPSVIDEIVETIGIEAEAKFARVEADYDETDNRLAVFLFFTDNDGNNVKADGVGIITVTKLDYEMERTGLPSSFDVEFEKDGFQTWRDSSGVKHTAYRFDIDNRFSGALWWDVSIDLVLEDGRTWVDVDNRFTSLDD